jgi:hypothetical protein
MYFYYNAHHQSREGLLMSGSEPYALERTICERALGRLVA